jgi:hypothetical protein
VENFWTDLADRCKALATSWAGYSAFGSFLLYLLGYLVTRFELTMLGIGTNLDVLNERYFFAGAKFAVYLFATVPTVLFLLLVPAGIVWLISRALPARLRSACVSRARSMRPATLYVVGIVFAVLAIQFVARQCFVFNNLLLAPTLPGPAWLQAVLLDDQGTVEAPFFAGLLGATAITAAFLFAGRSRPAENGKARVLEALLALLLAVQALLLPINYSILIAHKTFPRVSETSAVATGQTAWLIWENNDAGTFLVASAAAPQTDRGLITINRKESKDKDRILAYDPVLRILFPKSK